MAALEVAPEKVALHRGQAQPGKVTAAAKAAHPA
jgi:hypothetical protein